MPTDTALQKEIQKYVEKLKSGNVTRDTLTPQYVAYNLKQGVLYHNLIGVYIPENIAKNVYDHIKKNVPDKDLYGDKLYNGNPDKKEKGLKDLISSPTDKKQIEDAQDKTLKGYESPDLGNNEPRYGQPVKDNVYDPGENQKQDLDKKSEESDNEKKQDNDLENAESEEGDETSSNQSESNGQSVKEEVGEKAKEALADKAKDEIKNQAAKEAGKQVAKKALSQKAKQFIISFIGSKVFLVIGAIILIVIAVLGVAILLGGCSFGKNGHIETKAVANRGSIQTTLVASKLDNFKDSLDENLDKSTEIIKEIKNNASGDDKSEIIKTCDEVLKKIEELKSIPAPSKEKANEEDIKKREQLKNEIIELAKKIINYTSYNSTQLAQTILERINSGKASCYPGACTDLKSQANNGYVYNSRSQKYILKEEMLRVLLEVIDLGYNIEISTLASSHPGNWPNSRHHYGEAVDIFVVDGVSLVKYCNSNETSNRRDLEVVDYLKKNSGAKQIIYDNDYRMTSNTETIIGGGYYDNDVSVYGYHKACDTGHNNHIHMGY